MKSLAGTDRHSRSVLVGAVFLSETGQVAVSVNPPTDVDLQFIYRAGLSIYWDINKRRLEDRSDKVESVVASGGRIARAMREEYGIVLKPSARLSWEGIDDQAKNKLAIALFGQDC